MIREVLFRQKKRQKWTKSPIRAVVFVIMSLLSLLISWQGPVSLLLALGSSVAVVGIWCSDTAHIRAFSFPGVFLWLIYSILTHSLYPHDLQSHHTVVHCCWEHTGYLEKETVSAEQTSANITFPINTIRSSGWCFSPLCPDFLCMCYPYILHIPFSYAGLLHNLSNSGYWVKRSKTVVLVAFKVC